MKPGILLTVACLLLVHGSFSQSFETDMQARNEISKLGFLVGNWAGTGWMMGRDQQKHPFEQTERVQFKLDSTTLLVEGRGVSDGKVIHNALAVVSLHKEEGNYNFQSYLANGRRGSFPAELQENKFYWYPAENMRYIIAINEQGQWHEVGEMNRDGKWFQFFEMTLDKQ